MTRVASSRRARWPVPLLAALMLAAVGASAAAGDTQQAEGVSVADATAVAPSAIVSLTEGVAVADGSAIAPTVFSSGTEGVGVRDSTAVAPGIMVGVGEDVGVGDGTSIAPGLSVALGEGVAVDDLTSVLPGANVALGEGVLVGDGTSAQPQNTTPRVSLAEFSGDEGSAAAGAGSFEDPEAQSWSGVVDWGDGSPPEPLLLDVQKTFALRHVYDDDGSYQVIVTITDSAGASGQATATAHIRGVAPQALLSAPPSVDEGTSATIALTDATDVSHADTLAGFAYAFDCGDGFHAAVGASASCHFEDGPSSRTVRARITDKDGASNEYTTQVAVRNLAPTAVVSNDGPVPEGTPATLSFSNAQDASQADTAAGFTFSFACDGVTFTSDPHCTFDDGPSSHVVKARIADKDGGSTEVETTVRVTNAPPDGTLTNGGPVDEGAPVTVSFAGVTDPSLADRLAGFSYAFACDGVTFGAPGAAGSTTCTFDDGDSSHVVKGRITDKDGATVERATTVAVRNAAPTATLDAPGSVNEGSPFTVRLLAPHDASGADTAAGFRYAFDCGDGAGLGAFGPASSRTCPTDDNGARAVQAAIRDKDGGTTTYPASVQVQNVAPTARLVVPTAAVAEGATFTVALADATDVSGADRLAGLQFAFDCGAGYGPASSVAQATCTAVADPGTTVKAKVTDKDGGSTEYTAFVPIQNLPPTVAITQPAAQTVIPVGSSVSFAGTFTDAGRADTHTAQWAFDAATQAGTVTESNGSGTVAATRTFAAAGDYTVQLNVTDSSGGVGSDTRDALVVVVDAATRATVSVSGWIPAGVGRVEFDGSAKYNRNVLIASLTAQAPGIGFVSTRADWFVVSGRRAQWAGAGTLNGAPVTFVATAGAGPDGFRVVLRRPDGSIALDTSPGSPFDLDTAVLTRLGGGSIQIR